MLVNIAFSYLGIFHIVPFDFVEIVLEATTFSSGAFTLEAAAFLAGAFTFSTADLTTAFFSA